MDNGAISVDVNGCKLTGGIYEHDYTPYAPCKAIGVSVGTSFSTRLASIRIPVQAYKGAVSIDLNKCKVISDMYAYDCTFNVSCSGMNIGLDPEISTRLAGIKVLVQAHKSATSIDVNGCKLISGTYKYYYTSYIPCKALGISLGTGVSIRLL